ncbi:MAG: hypothetical protein HYT89_02540 [Candidatus Omnitrophica bacterium]|nr:hypothetical protein [Candidatus Omnitrophota bacterium]
MPDSNSGYLLHPDGRFVIRGYNEKRPFSNFLPGIAGFYGTPLWVFCVNRGQGIASFGTKDKDHAILEFFPANKAYQNTPRLGFRTFVKLRRSGSLTPHFYEPFRPGAPAEISQEMAVSSHELTLGETHAAAGLKSEVRYFTVPGEPLAALARELVLTNVSSRPLDLEILDGLPQVNPYGMNEFFVKHMSRTIEAWMRADNVHKRAPFYRLSVDASDRPEVTPIEEGNFFFSVSQNGELLETLADPEKVFGTMSDLHEPRAFLARTPFKVPQDQMLASRTPCAFSFCAVRLAPGQSRKVRSYFGQARSLELLNRYAARAKAKGYFEEKAEENRRLIEGIKSMAFTVTSSPAYDLYCGQTYLDNVLRGGLPVRVGGGDFISYVYSRKHGDLERDYNRFVVEPDYFAQGNGNYRDINQNRRNDVWFEPLVKDSNIKMFLNLLQLDGFNPLITKGTLYTLRRSKESRAALKNFIGAAAIESCEAFVRRPFTIGALCRFLEEKGLVPRARFGGLLKGVAPFLARIDEAEHGEGFWVDHWTYNLDLIESYLAIYPEHEKELLFEKKEFTFHDGDHRVRTREEKYFLKGPQTVRQYRAVAKDEEKIRRIRKRPDHPYLVRTRFGEGEIYRTTLVVKFLCLFANKLASLDPEGVGLEMEADKPSWYDSLNGLPGLLGSSLSETFELKRLALFLIQAVEDHQPDLAEGTALPAELADFIKRLDQVLCRHLASKGGDLYDFWDTASRLKESFREKTRFGLSGRQKKISFAEIRSFLEHAREKIEMGLARAYDGKQGLYPTYFENAVVSYKALKSPRPVGPVPSNDGMTGRVWPRAFRQTALPLFLEGPVHALKVEKDPERKKRLLQAVRRSGLYDAKLGMYKVNAPLESASLEIGRARVFVPGWLENESVWLHMEYKFLLEVLKSGMPEEFFADFKKALVPFQPPARYGRSILENSSFLVSSAFPDRSLHGVGFVARLSGSTAEFLSMWLLMNAGKRPFFLDRDGRLALRFQPSLPAWFFLKEETARPFQGPDGATAKVRVPKDALAFLFLGKTLVFYHNPKRLDTFGKWRVSPKKIALKDARGHAVELKGDTIPAPHAQRVREGKITRIDIELG